jgi:hypothetical protein
MDDGDQAHCGPPGCELHLSAAGRAGQGCDCSEHGVPLRLGSVRTCGRGAPRMALSRSSDSGAPSTLRRTWRCNSSESRRLAHSVSAPRWDKRLARHCASPRAPETQRPTASAKEAASPAQTTRAASAATARSAPETSADSECVAPACSGGRQRSTGVVSPLGLLSESGRWQCQATRALWPGQAYASFTCRLLSLPASVPHFAHPMKGSTAPFADKLRGGRALHGPIRPPMALLQYLAYNRAASPERGGPRSLVQG